MNYTELDKSMRSFEQSLDQNILPELYLVARLDGRGFTRLTKEMLDLDRPFDVRFKDAMVQTVQRTMQCGFRIVYGYTQSDEISLLFTPEENTFGRKVRKLTSVLAGEASAQFSLLMGTAGVFDCRLIPLPNEQRVVDYFRWRAEDASRNALSAWCYWILRDEGASAQQATQTLSGMSTMGKHDLLFDRQINFNELPAWQKRGTGLYYERNSKETINPVTGQTVVVDRMALYVDSNLPMASAYESFLQEILNTVQARKNLATP